MLLIQIIVASAALLTALRLIWKKGIVPLWNMSRKIFRIVEVIYDLLPHIEDLPQAMPTLLEIAEEFKPNDGNSLADRVALIDLKMGEMSNDISIHLLHRKPGGQRFTDPI